MDNVQKFAELIIYLYQLQ